MKTIFLLSFIILSLSLCGQDYWNYCDTITAPPYQQQGTFNRDYAWGDGLLVVASNLPNCYGTRELARVYEPVGEKWVNVATLIARDFADSLGNGISYENFGVSLDADGDRVIIVGTRNIGTFVNGYIFKKPKTGWNGITLESSVITEEVGIQPDANAISAKIKDTVAVLNAYGHINVFHETSPNNWMKKGDFNIGTYVSYDILNDSVILSYNASALQDANYNIIYYGSVDVATWDGATWNKEINKIRAYSTNPGGHFNGPYNFGRKFQILTHNLVVESSDSIFFYNLTDNINWSTDILLPFRKEAITNFSVSDDVMYSWKNNKMYYDNRDAGDLSVLDNLDLKEMSTTYAKGDIYGNYYFTQVSSTVPGGGFNVYELNKNNAGWDSFTKIDTISPPLNNRGWFGYNESSATTDKYAFIHTADSGYVFMYTNDHDSWNYTGTINVGSNKIGYANDSLVITYKNTQVYSIQKNSDWITDNTIKLFDCGFSSQITTLYYASNYMAVASFTELKAISYSNNDWDITHAATLSVPASDTLDLIVAANNFIAALTVNDSILFYLKGDNWTDMNSPSFTIGKDSVLADSTYNLYVQYLLNNEPTHSENLSSNYSKRRGDFSKTVLAIPEYVSTGIFHLEDPLIPQLFGYRDLAVSENYIITSHYKRTTDKGYMQGVYDIFKRTFNNPPHKIVQLDTVIVDEVEPSSQEFRDTINIAELYRDFEDSTSFFTTLDSIKYVPEQNFTYKPQLYYSQILITIDSYEYGEIIFYYHVSDQLGKSTYDSLHYIIKPIINKLQLNSPFRFSYGDTLPFKAKRFDRDGEEVKFVKIVNANNLKVSLSDSMQFNTGDFYPIDSTILLEAISAGEASITLAGAFDSTGNGLGPETTSIGTIDKGILTVTILDTSRVYHEPNPDFTLIYSGFANGDYVSDIDTLPTVITSADIESNAGEYSIQYIGGYDDNYLFTHTGQGILTILKADQIITFDPDSVVYMFVPNSLYTFNATSSSGYAVFFKSSDLSVIYFDGLTAHLINPGEVIITAFVDSSYNYNRAEVERMVQLKDGTIGVDNINSNTAVSVFPNPTSDNLNLTLSTTKNEPVNVSIFNIEGKLMHKFSYTNLAGTYTEQLDLNDLPTGLYYLKICLSGISNNILIIYRN